MRHDFNESPVIADGISFGEYIRKKRRLMGMNQTDFGKIFGLHQHTISEYEIGESSPTVAIAEEMLRRIGGEIVIREKAI